MVCRGFLKILFHDSLPLIFSLFSYTNVIYIATGFMSALGIPYEQFPQNIPEFP